MTRPSRAPEVKILTFRVGEETFGLPVLRVQTIFRIAAITRVPLGPPTLLGLVNLRGAIIPALSLTHRLGLSGAAAAIGALAIGIGEGSRCFALVVDDVGDVIAVDGSEALVMPPHACRARAAVTEAVYRLPDGVLPILDVEALVHRAEPGGDRQSSLRGVA